MNHLAPFGGVPDLCGELVEGPVRQDDELLCGQELDDEEEGRHLGMRMGGSNKVSQ